VKHIIFALILLLSNSVFSKSKEKVEFGIYVEDIYNIDYINSSYDIVFWVWVNAEDEYYNPNEYIDFVRSTDIKFNYPSQFQLNDGRYHSETKVTARILNQFDATAFPFDIQYINFHFEFFKLTRGESILVFDEKNSRLIPEYIQKWRILKVDHKILNNRYSTNFGYHDLGKRIVYQGLNVKIELERNKWSLFIKMFLTLFISFFLASFSLFLPNKLSEEKIGLMLASLFASVGNKYITDSSLPVQDTLNLSDKLHVLTIVFVALFAIYAIYEQRKKIKDNRRLDYFMFFLSCFLYFGLVLILCI
jgi:hypothetical protein